MQLKIMKIHPLLLLFLIYLGLFSSSIYSIPAEQQELFDSLPPALQAQALSRMEEEQVADYKGTTAKEQNKIQSSLRKISDKEREADAIECAELKCIFGYEIFRDSPISFVSTMVAPITSSYLLGPGDILRISYFGSYDRLREAEIDNNGNYDLPLLGPVNISGLNIEKAQQIISEKVEAELIGTKASISLTEFRSITVFIRTSPFDKNRKYYSNSLTIDLPIATNNSLELVKTAIEALKRIYKYGYFYQKAGVILSKLNEAGEKELNLLTPILEKKSQKLMKAMDLTNSKYGRNVISVAQAGINNSWKMRREHSSKIDTASFDSLPKISI